MKAKLIFNLPDEETEFRNAVNGTYLKLAIGNFDEHLRHMMKHEEIYKIDVYEVRDLLRKKLDEYNLSIE